MKDAYEELIGADCSDAIKNVVVSRSKLIFQIHKQTHSVHNHIPNFKE